MGIKLNSLNGFEKLARAKRKAAVDLEMDENGNAKELPTWRRTPTQAKRAVQLGKKTLAQKIDEYFAKQYDQGLPITMCDMAGAAGFDSVTQLINHARRRGGKTMRHISRGLLAVAASYEEQAQQGNRAAVHMLSLVPNFDSEEPAAQKPELPFLPQREVNFNITGVARPDTAGAHLSEQEAYLRLIKYKTYEEISAEVLETEKDVDGDFQVLELDSNEQS